MKSSKQDATKKQIRRVEGNLAVGGGTFGVRLRDQHFAMTGITSSSDMYLLFIMICNRQRCASLYCTVGLQYSAIALTTGREPLTLSLRSLRRQESKRLPVCIHLYPRHPLSYKSYNDPGGVP